MNHPLNLNEVKFCPVRTVNILRLQLPPFSSLTPPASLPIRYTWLLIFIWFYLWLDVLVVSIFVLTWHFTLYFLRLLLTFLIRSLNQLWLFCWPAFSVAFRLFICCWFFLFCAFSIYLFLLFLYSPFVYNNSCDLFTFSCQLQFIVLCRFSLWARRSFFPPLFPLTSSLVVLCDCFTSIGGHLLILQYSILQMDNTLHICMYIHVCLYGMSVH